MLWPKPISTPPDYGMQLARRKPRATAAWAGKLPCMSEREPREHLHEHPHGQSRVQHACVLARRQDLHLPETGELEPRTILLPILLLHSFRHPGLMFLTPGGTYPGIPSQFAYPAAIGDLLAAVLALAAVPAVANGARGAWTLVWIFNVEGTLDLGAAITLATIYGTAAYMGSAYQSSGFLPCW
jgi:hypothetical protein